MAEFGVEKQFAVMTDKNMSDDGVIWCLQFGPVDHIDFCQQSPFNFAVTSATRVSAAVVNWNYIATQHCMYTPCKNAAGSWGYYVVS